MRLYSSIATLVTGDIWECKELLQACKVAGIVACAGSSSLVGATTTSWPRCVEAACRCSISAGGARAVRGERAPTRRGVWLMGDGG